jgi:type IV pilus biogenesis protein CpaD/CtpE
MRTRLFIPVAVAALAALSGCATDGPNGMAYMGGPDNFGEANRQTYAAQIIDPAPVYDTAVAESSGDHAAQAIDRYRTDKVKKPERINTSNVKTSGGGGGGGGGN